MHGKNWKDHSFLGCAGDGQGSFAASPQRMLSLSALLADLEAGKSVPVSESEIKSFVVAFM